MKSRELSDANMEKIMASIEKCKLLRLSKKQLELIMKGKTPNER